MDEDMTLDDDFPDIFAEMLEFATGAKAVTVTINGVVQRSRDDLRP